MEASTPEAAYDSYGETYRTWWAPIIRPSAVALLDRLDGQVPMDRTTEVLDVGTGTGTLALAAVERWPSCIVTGVDPSRVMLEMAAEDARRRGSDVEARSRWLLGEADRMRLPDASVDLVISSFVIQLVPSRAAALREMRRVLRPGGHLALLTWIKDDEHFEPEDLVQLAFDELDIEVPDVGSDRHPYSGPAAAAAELRRMGFRDVSALPEWLVHRFTPQGYLDVAEHWIEDDVFADLTEPRRAELRARILAMLEALEPDVLVWRRPLVSVVARRP